MFCGFKKLVLSTRPYLNPETLNLLPIKSLLSHHVQKETVDYREGDLLTFYEVKFWRMSPSTKFIRCFLNYFILTVTVRDTTSRTTLSNFYSILFLYVVTQEFPVIVYSYLFGSANIRIKSPLSIVTQLTTCFRHSNKSYSAFHRGKRTCRINRCVWPEFLRELWPEAKNE